MPISNLQDVAGPFQQLAKNVSAAIDISTADFEDARGFAIMNNTGAAGNITFMPLEGEADLEVSVNANQLARAGNVVFLARAVKSSSAITSIRAVYF